MSDTGDTVILHQELAYADSLPLLVQPLEQAVDAATLTLWTERNLRVLHTCAALEESAQTEGLDDPANSPAELQRIDLKLNLLMEMMGILIAATQARPMPRPLRFNAQGLLWEPGSAPPAAGIPVRVEIHLRDIVVQPLVLTGVMQDSGSDTLGSVQFDELPEPVADHIKRLVFRRHRRQVAVVRATRRI